MTRTEIKANEKRLLENIRSTATTPPKMNIVEQVARMIDPAAFVKWVSTTPVGNLEKARTEYKKSAALALAAGILKLAVKTPKLREKLVKIEVDGWRELGVPIESAELLRTIEEKFACP